MGHFTDEPTKLPAEGEEFSNLLNIIKDQWVLYTTTIMFTFSGRQMKIRSKSAEAREARNTLVGLCLTWVREHCLLFLSHTHRFTMHHTNIGNLLLWCQPCTAFLSSINHHQQHQHHQFTQENIKPCYPHNKQFYYTKVTRGSNLFRWIFL